MQRVTHLSGTLWFGLNSRHWLFRLWDTSRPVKPYLTALCRLLTALVQALLPSKDSFVSAKGCFQHSCFCLAVTYSTPIQLYFFWWPETWRNGSWRRLEEGISASTAVEVLGKYSGSPKHSLLFNPVLHGEGGEVQPVLQVIPTVRRCLLAFSLWTWPG